MKIVYIVLLAVLLTGCCKEEIIGRYPLSDIENALIPNRGIQNIEYIDELGQTVIAQTTPAITENKKWRPGTGCSYTEYQETYGNLNFPSENFTLKLEVYKLFDGFFSITIKRDESDSVNQGCRIPLDRPIEEKITDISIGEYEFSDVIVFENCEFGSDINRIIYSPGKGMEYIEFSDESFYKLN